MSRAIYKAILFGIVCTLGFAVASFTIAWWAETKLFHQGPQPAFVCRGGVRNTHEVTKTDSGTGDVNQTLYVVCNNGEVYTK